MKRHTATVSSKSQIVLPREVRDRLGVQMGDKIEFILDETGIHVLPVQDHATPFDAWLGAAPGTEGPILFEEQTRHAGLSRTEIELLRAGPGARITHLKTDVEDR